MRGAGPSLFGDERLHPRTSNAPAERMAWLVRLRWIALAGVLLATVAARVIGIRGVNEPVIVAAVIGGLIYNALFARDLRRNPHRRLDPLLHVLPDFGALTVVLWASGGVHNPFLSLFFVHVLLVTTLGGRRAFLLACTAALVSAAFLLAVEAWPLLRISTLVMDSTSSAFLSAAAFAVTVVGSAFVADRAQVELLARKKEAEAARRERQRNADILLAALDRLEVGVEILQPDGTATLRNRHLRSLAGEEICRMHSHGCQPLGTRCAVEEAREGKPATCRFSTRDRGGRERVMELLSFPLSDEVPAPVLRLHVDRTESVLAERKLVFAERLASLGRTVQAVAHELNTPLATIQTLAADMRAALADAGTDLDALRKDLDESAALILDEMRRCRSITQGLLAGRDRLQKDDQGGDLGAAVDRAATLVFGTGSARKVLDVDPALQGAVAGMDADSLVQVFVNLLQNAQDAIADRPGAGIRVRLGTTEDGWAVCVEDDGPGFPPGVRDRLLEPFFTTKPPGKGTGLGLYTVDSLLREAGGRLELEDAPSGGARAIAYVPRGEVE